MSLALKKHEKFVAPEGPLLIVIMDGVGMGAKNEGNAVHRAHTPNLDRLMSLCPWRTLMAHGTAVGLPSDQDMGNSEVGHNAIGSGKVCDQGAKLVNKSLDSGELFQGETWQWLLQGLPGPGGGDERTLHIIGLLSDGNVHSHINQQFALIDGADRDGVGRLRFHALLDGRDVGETTALNYVDSLGARLQGISAKPDRDYRIASGGGRMAITMDRYEADLAMVKRGWECHVEGKGRRFSSAREAIETYREEQAVTDQFLPGFVIADETGPVGTIHDGDSVIFANFRGDRAIEISRAFEEKEFWGMPRERVPSVRYAGMMQYDGDLKLPKKYLVAPPVIQETMGEYLAESGLAQLAISETQKYGHVTYFWNGNRSGKFDESTETYIEVPSDLIPFEQRPWMKAAEITDAVIRELGTGKYRQARINLANGDMVGHTGKLHPAILSVETVDLCLGRLVDAIRKMKGIALITADHGNSDEMLMMKGGEILRDASGSPQPKTSHTLNPVPLILCDSRGPGGYSLIRDGKFGIGNIAATALNLMGYRTPEGFLESMVGHETERKRP